VQKLECRQGYGRWRAAIRTLGGHIRDVEAHRHVCTPLAADSLPSLCSFNDTAASCLTVQALPSQRVRGTASGHAQRSPAGSLSVVKSAEVGIAMFAKAWGSSEAAR
jgi:hypothetical protein